MITEFEMGMRSLGFSHPDFAHLSLDELYHRFCIAYKRIQEQSNEN